MKVGLDSSFFGELMGALSGRRCGSEIVPYIDRFLSTHPYAGTYQVDDEPRKPKKKEHFHPSGDCLKCERLLYFEMVGEPVEERIEPRLQAIFKVGSALHAMIQAWFEEMGRLREAGDETWPEFLGSEVRIDYPEMNMGAYMDAVVRFPEDEQPTVIEIKTISSGAFASLAGPKPEHRQQVGCYLEATGYPAGIVLYVNKDTQEFREFRVERFDMTPVRTRWGDVMGALARGSADGLTYGCKPGTPQWSRCPMRMECFR